MKFGVVVFPGSNCDHDMQYALENLNREVRMIWHKESTLSDFNIEDCIVLPGGFSYGDYLRSGAIARFSPIMQAVVEFAKNGGRVIGICNGFQILCEAGLLPGALLHNSNERFICKNIHLSVCSTTSPMSRALNKGDVLKIPIAHAEGRYYADQTTLQKLKTNDQIVFRYSDENGGQTIESNPNGSLDHIAGICNENRNVVGLMPHPERASDEALGNMDGKEILNSLLTPQTIPV